LEIVVFSRKILMKADVWHAEEDMRDIRVILESPASQPYNENMD
jgi:hypothetical protein